MFIPIFLSLITFTVSINLPPTFTTQLLPNADAIRFPQICTIQSSPSSPSSPPTPFPCRPALFGPRFYNNSSIQIVWYHNNGCTNDTKSIECTSETLKDGTCRSDDYTDQFVLISRGKCPFVTKAYHAQHYNNAAGVIIVDHPSKEADRAKLLTGRSASADSTLIKMWSEASDLWMADLITIPVLSIRNEYSKQIQSQYVSFNWTSKSRAYSAYISGHDRIARYNDTWNATLQQIEAAQIMYKSLGLSSTILKSYIESEQYFRKSIAAYNSVKKKDPKAVPVIHQLGVMLLNHTNNDTKWNESLKYLPGSKAYLCILSEVLISRVTTGRIPTFANMDSLLTQGLFLLKKAYKIKGGVYTPRVSLNQAHILTLLNSKQNNNLFDPSFIRDKIIEAFDDAAAYGNEKTSINAATMLKSHDQLFPYHTPIWMARKRIARVWWEWIKDSFLWPIRAIFGGNKVPEPEPPKRKYGSGKALEDYQGYRL